MKKNEYLVNGYTLTENPDFQNEKFGITTEVNRLLENLYFEAKNKNNTKVISKLNALIEKYPQIPILKNYLSVAYEIRGDIKKGQEINEQILVEHPDYLFGKLNKAYQSIELGEMEKVPQILGETLELKDLYPTRDVFHLSELTGYLKLIVSYGVAIDDLELAENKMKFLIEVAPHHPDTESAENFLIRSRLLNATKRMLEDQKRKIIPKINQDMIVTSKTTAPNFNHPEIQWLYLNGLRIPAEQLQTILSLPRQTLIEDLETVLEDGINRFSQFEECFEEEKTSFVLHSMLLLTELDSVESLSKIFSFFKLPSNIISHWIGDHITETIWLVFYKLAFSNTQLLKSFMLEPEIYTYSKVAASEALCQLYLHHPERKEEILSIYSDLFTAFLNSDIEDNLIDSDFIGLAITDAEDCEFTELLPVIKELYEHEYVSEGICGSYSDLEKTFGQDPFTKVEEIYSIPDLYQHIITTWSGYTEEFEEEVDNKNIPFNFDFNSTKQQAVSTKIGRNEPCPCGSGKKYKKCCGGN